MIQIFQILLMSLYCISTRKKNHLKLRRESIDIKSQIYVIRNGSIRNVDLRLLHTMNVRFSLLDIAQRILGVTLPNFQ